MKKLVLLIIVGTLILSSNAYAINLKDVDKHWASFYITELVDKNVIKGYPDGTFKPDNELTIGEFLSLVINATEKKENESLSEGHWAMNYYNNAISAGLINKDVFSVSQLDKKITRLEMSIVISNLLNTKNANIDYSNIKNIILDFDTIKQSDMKYSENILFAYYNGIITGYPDKTFKPYKTLTRAEATVIILRCLNEEYRSSPKLADKLPIIDISQLESDMVFNRENYESKYLNKEFIISGYAYGLTNFGIGYDSDYYVNSTLLKIYDGNGKYSNGLNIGVKMSENGKMSEKTASFIKSLKFAMSGYKSLPAGDYIEIPIKYIGNNRYILLTE